MMPTGGSGRRCGECRRDAVVLVRTDFGTWERYECGAGEFIVRLLTDGGVLPSPGRIAAHCFLDYV